MTGKEPPSSKRSRSNAAKTSSRAVYASHLSNISGHVNIAGGDLVQNIQTIYERALTPGEVTNKDLKLEMDLLASGVRDYLDGLKQQVLNPRNAVPYKELEAYTISESETFFGREQSIHDLLQAMQRGSLTILQAESGAGKTSLLQAGIVPQVIAMEGLALLIRSQFENPSHTIKECLLGNLDLAPKLASTRLVNFLHVVSAILGRQTTLYIILDQFEEFFAKQTLEADRQEFIRDLAECLNDASLNIRWVIAITSDALGQMGKFEPLIRHPFSNVQSLYLFSYKDAAEVITNTAQHHGLSFEKGLLERILDDLGNGRNDPIAPTQIQLVCAALYKDIQDKSTVFTHAQYDAKNGAQGILHGYIDRVLQHELPLEERPVAYKVLEALVTSEKKRLIRTKGDLEASLQSQGIASEAVEATLNHLVAERLLRRHGDDPQHIQYEIVHDYLLKEIEIDEKVRSAKEAEELAEQGLKNWSKQKLLIAPDALRILEAQAGDISISSATAQLLFLSAVEYNRPAKRWRDLISIEDQKLLIPALLSQTRSRANREALWSLRQHLPTVEKTKVTVARSSLALLTSLQKGVVLLMLGAALVVTSIIVIESSLVFVPWSRETSLNAQCIGGKGSANLLIGLDAADGSHLVVYDPGIRTLCETRNTGSKWKSINQNLPQNLTINGIAINSTIYLATDQGIYYQADKPNWSRLDTASEDGSAFQKIAVSPDRKNIYVSTEQNVLYQYDVSTGKCTILHIQGLTGKITDLTINYAYFAVSTLDGVWYKQISSQKPWTKYVFLVDQNVTIATLKLVYPLKPRRNYDPRFDDWFLATTQQGEMYSGKLLEPLQWQKVSPSPTQLSSLVVNGYSKFGVNPDGLYCEQSWYLYDVEWWLRFSRAQPCQ